MANTIIEYVSDGIETIYDITFALGYISKSHVFVYTGDNTTYETQLDYTWINSTQIQLAAPELDQVVVKIRRVVPRDTLVKDYKDGALLPEKDLDDSFKQTLMILEEADDGFTNFAQQVDIDMNNNRIINLATPVNPSDAATLQIVLDVVVGQVPSGSETVIGIVKLSNDAEGGDEANNITALTPKQFNASRVLAKLLGVDGVGSELDSDYLDGQHGSFYQNADNLNAGNIPNARLPAGLQQSSGVWTPNLWNYGSGASYGPWHGGEYNRIGNQVFVQGILDVLSATTWAANKFVKIRSLPFPIDINLSHPTFTVGLYYGLLGITNLDLLMSYQPDVEPYYDIMYFDTGGTVNSESLPTTSMSHNSGSVIRFSGTYITDAA